MRLQFGPPAPELQPFVRKYHLREAELGSATRRAVFPARPDQFLEFYLASQSEVVLEGSGGRALAPRSVVVGTQAIGRVELFLGGTIRTFTIQFQPAGFHELLRIPMVELAGKGLDASGVLGPRIDWLNNQLCNSPNFETMAHVADEFLLYFLKTSGRMTDPFFANLSSNLNRVLGGVSRVELDTLVNDSGVGQRQFERRFKTAIGVSPKRYLRVARLHRALRLRERRPEWAWGRIASECGFHDQMHLIHDFRELGGEAPNALFREMTNLREQMSEIYYR